MTIYDLTNMMPNEIGRKIRLIHTDDRFTLLKPNDEGVIVDITTLPEGLEGRRQIWCNWKNGSRLALIEGIDEFTILDK